MLIEISLVIIAAAMIILSIFLAIIAYQTRKTIQLVQKDVHSVAQEAARILNTINGFINKDLHSISQEVNHLVKNANIVSSDVKKKISSFNFLFRPLSFLNSKFGTETSPTNSSNSQGETFSQIFKWIQASMFLIKATKEFRKHEK